MSKDIDYDFSIHGLDEKTVRCRGMDKTDKKDCEGEYFGNICVDGITWAIVLWDGDEDPDLYKAHCLWIAGWKCIK